MAGGGHVGGHAEVSLRDFRPTGTGIAARAAAAAALVAAVLLLPVTLETTQDLWFGLAAIYAIIGLSVNIITGHAGQISLGHQAFVGIGAFASAFVVKAIGNFPEVGGVVLPPDAVPTSDFSIALIVAGLIGAATAVVLGVVALRIRGLYLALITLAFGLMAENTIFYWEAFTGGGAGAFAPRPAAFRSNQAFAYVCLLVLGVFAFVDWRLVRSRAGRAIVAFRNDERVAMTLGVNVTMYKLLAFAMAGFLAGVAGGLFGHWNEGVAALDFELRTALVWVLMAVVGGLGSRAGVIAGSTFFAVFPLYLSAAAGGATLSIPLVGEVLIQTLSPFFGALLLLLTITLYPGGIAQQLLPFRRWFAGGALVESRHEAFRLAGFPFLIGLLTVLGVAGGGVAIRFLIGVVVGLVLAAVVTILLLLYLRAAYRTVSRAPAHAAPAAEGAVAPGAAEVIHAGDEAAAEAATAGHGDALVDVGGGRPADTSEPTSAAVEDDPQTAPATPGDGSTRSRGRRKAGSRSSRRKSR